MPLPVATMTSEQNPEETTPAGNPAGSSMETSGLTPELVWELLTPSDRAKYQAIGMRLVLAYADHSAQRVAAGAPTRVEDARLVMVALAKGMAAYGRAGAGLPEDRLWAAVTTVVDRTAPAAVRADLRALLARTTTAAVQPSALGQAIAAAESLPHVSVHLGAAVIAVVSQYVPGNLDHLRRVAVQLEATTTASARSRK